MCTPRAVRQSLFHISCRIGHLSTQFIPNKHLNKDNLAALISTEQQSSLSASMPRPSYRTCDGVSDVCPVEATTYGYYPDLAGNAFFAAWFGLLLIAQLVLGFKNRTWTYMIALGLGTFGELMGYIGRLLMHNNPWNSPAFQVRLALSCCRSICS